MKRLVAFAAASSLALGALAVVGASAPAGAVGETVSITFALDLPDFCADGPLVFQVTDVAIGAGPELTGDASEITSNPCGWRGAPAVDVDPVTKQVTVTTANSNTFQTAVLTVTYPGVGSVQTLSDNLWIAADAPECNMVTPPTLSVLPGDAGFTVSWSVPATGCFQNSAQLSEGSSVFEWGDAAPTTTTTTTEAPTTTTSEAPAVEAATAVAPAFTG